jgi:hypothetical protein
MKLPNRDKAVNELARRYEEVLRKSESGIHNDEEAQQFIALIAHYINYVKKNQLTQNAISALFKNKETLASDQVLIDEADKIIAQLKKDRDKVVKFAARHDIDTGPYQFDTSGVAQQITLDKEVSFNLSSLDNYLKLPSDQQRVSELPNQIGNFRSMLFATAQLASETKMLKKLKSDYIDISEDFAKKLRMQGVYLDYLRVEDYQALELVWREVYQEGNRDERIIFHLMYGDLFEKNRNFSQDQQRGANDFVAKHMTHIQRVHNYLTDELENVPSSEKFTKWFVEHFGPTFVSLILIIIIYLILHRLDSKIDINSVKSWLGN